MYCCKHLVVVYDGATGDKLHRDTTPDNTATAAAAAAAAAGTASVADVRDTIQSSSQSSARRRGTVAGRHDDASRDWAPLSGPRVARRPTPERRPNSDSGGSRPSEGPPKYKLNLYSTDV